MKKSQQWIKNIIDFQKPIQRKLSKEPTDPCSVDPPKWIKEYHDRNHAVVKVPGANLKIKLNTLQSRLQISGYPDIRFLIINSADSVDDDGKLFQKLTKLAGQVATYQEQITEPVWKKLDVLENNILVLDRCGRLTYHVLVPWSLLHEPYVKAAILSTYLDNPCGRCRTGRKKLNSKHKHKHGYKQNKLNANAHRLYKSEDILTTTTLHTHTYTREEHQSTTLLPVVEMPDGTVPIRITYQNPHVHTINGKQKEFKLVELQIGNPNYIGHPDEKVLKNIIYKGESKGKGDTKNKLRKNTNSKIESNNKYFSEKLKAVNTFGNSEIIDKTEKNSTDSQSKYEHITNKTDSIKLVIQKKNYEPALTLDQSKDLKVVLPKNQENKFKQKNVYNKFGDIRIDVRKKCKSKKCLEGSITDKKTSPFKSEYALNKTTEDNNHGNSSIELYTEVYQDTTKHNTSKMHITDAAESDTKFKDIRVKMDDKVVNPFTISESIKNLLNNSAGVNLHNADNKTYISSSFEKSNFSDSASNGTTMEIKNRTFSIDKDRMDVSNTENIMQITTMSGFVEDEGSILPANVEKWDKQIESPNKTILVETNSHSPTSHPLVDETVVPNLDKQVKNITEEIIKNVNLITGKFIQGVHQNEFNKETTPIAGDSNEYVDDNLYDDISQEEESRVNELKDQKNNDKLLEKMSAHYSKILPWVNYTLSTSV